ncbi:gluconate 2-dehydrogenase subunit 3 family protein [Cyclobacterium jeungdonense]|uniref:Gluconate 2-dehydrogenase subunit 3 family protein n=1 Tax=Cyclobacterium jeungdonense TaxID=708087 RepID=A0ABT8CAR7_9BACT|nr:gluconate 2-dehydrogenase subunit 3 family protein [Cyclobacterium jeungdonense]MDN3689600.1 gluconate 2-dehydrogenase subunit 3 family protein [Cyclobacterium jeungdonense]
MDRRSAMKQLALLTGGVVLIPACDFSEESILQAHQNLKITASQKELLTQVINTIFPGKVLKPSEELQLPDFVLVMCNDCLDKEQQETFVSGLQQWDAFSKEQFGKKFSQMNSTEAEDCLRTALTMDGKEEEKKSAIGFVNTTKRFALQGYLNSEYFMTEIKPYELVPARFYGSKKIENA